VSRGSCPASKRRRSCSRETLERVQFNITAAKSWAGGKHKRRRCGGCRRTRSGGGSTRGTARGGRGWEGKVPNQRPTHGLKGADATPHLRRRARCVSDTFAHSLAFPGETTAHSRDASVPAEYGPADSTRGHDGTVMFVTSAEMPVPITAPTFTTTTITTPTKHPQATTATITNKSSRASLQLTHELGDYIRRMSSRALTENVKDTTNTKTIRLSLSVTP
jgi:hypothetical protein